MRNLFWVCVVSFVLCAMNAFADEAPPLSPGAMAEYKQIHGDGNYTAAQQAAGDKRAEYFRKDVRDLPALAERTNVALRGIFNIGVRNLRRHGYRKEALQIERGWRKHDGELQAIVQKRLAGVSDDIGDFAPLSNWLGIAYEVLELALGYEKCYTLRLSDIKTINFTIPVVFDPCTYGETEFTLHFVHDAKYRGLAPVVAYWTTVVTCSIATFGGGYFFVCSPIGMLVEVSVDKAIAPWLAPKLYSLACH